MTEQKLNSAAQIERELAATNKRLAELETQFAEQARVADNAQADFVNGKGSLDKSLTERGKLDALCSAVESLADLKQQLEIALDAAQKREKREKSLAELGVLANKALAAYGRFVDLSGQFERELLKNGESLWDAKRELLKTREAYQNKARFIADLRPDELTAHGASPKAVSAGAANGEPNIQPESWTARQAGGLAIRILFDWFAKTR